ncbi:MAG: hypothetical protein J5846_11070 [Desulfovibrio sp.]|nr:hypothetical protein [Desulfovibrio sp.]
MDCSSNLNILRKASLGILQKAKDAAHGIRQDYPAEDCHANPENILKILACEPLC